MEPKLILNRTHLEVTIDRLCYQLIEAHNDFSETALVALQPRGVHLGRRIKEVLSSKIGIKNLKYGELDTTFFRDDFRRREKVLVPKSTNMDFIVEDRNVVLIDDVLFTGRTIRAGLDAMQAFGRPRSVELIVLIDRRYSRHLPIEPNYTGKIVDSISSEKVLVNWGDNMTNDLPSKNMGDEGVWLLTEDADE